MKKPLLLIIVLVVVLNGCSNRETPNNFMTSVQGTWHGHAVIKDEMAGLALQQDVYTDSLLAYYDSQKGNSYLQLKFEDSFCWVSGLNFYTERRFTASFATLGGTNMKAIMLVSKSTSEDSLLASTFQNKHQAHLQDSSTSDSTQSESEFIWSFGTEPEPVHAEYEYLELSNVQLKGNRLICDVLSNHSQMSTQVVFTRLQ